MLKNVLATAAKQTTRQLTQTGSGLVGDIRRGHSSLSRSPALGMPGNNRTSSVSGLPPRTGVPNRELHSMAAGTMHRFNNPQAFKELAAARENVIISTFESLDQVRKSNPDFDKAAEEGRRIFEERGLKLEFAFGVDTTKRPEEDANVAAMMKQAHEKGVDMTVVDARFLRSNAETQEADEAYLQATAQAQYDMGVRKMTVTHTLDSKAARGAPDADALEQAFHPFFTKGETEQVSDKMPIESSPRGERQKPAVLRMSDKAQVGRTDFHSTREDDAV